MNVDVCSESIDMLSICTGGGGLDLGVELAIPGARAVCMVEREALACAQLVSAMEAGLLAPAAIWSDAGTFDGRPWRGLVDGLVGGIPCQPHSLAGKRLGENDERDLWSTARRIIVQSGAWFVLIENVRGMLSSGGAERVWRDLQRLGFKVEGGLFTAAEVGAPHERERLFILAVADRDSEHGDRPRVGWTRWGRQSANGGGEVRAVGLADTYIERLARSAPGEGARQRDEGTTSERDGRSLEHTARIGCGEGRTEPEFWNGWRSSAGTGNEMADAGGDGQFRCAEPDGGETEHVQQASRRCDTERRDLVVDNPVSHRRRNWRQDHRGNEWDEPRAASIFPPRPNDFAGWRNALAAAPELEPSFRRVADGLASRLDTARVDRLRMLGNGVVPLQAAYALRTLATRLAAGGSSGAARLVRLMEVAA